MFAIIHFSFHVQTHTHINAHGFSRHFSTRLKFANPKKEHVLNHLQHKSKTMKMRSAIWIQWSERVKNDNNNNSGGSEHQIHLLLIVRYYVRCNHL